MGLLVFSYVTGALMIISPCILPILPFAFLRAEQPFSRGILPILIGMAPTFSAVTSIAAVGGDWAVRANEIGRYGALLSLALFAVALISQRATAVLPLSIVALSNRIYDSGEAATRSIGGSLLLGIATGLLWAPCAGPIPGLVLTGARAAADTALLLAAYTAGAATSFALALEAGGQVFTATRRSLGLGGRSGGRGRRNDTMGHDHN